MRHRDIKDTGGIKIANLNDLSGVCYMFFCSTELNKNISIKLFLMTEVADIY